eukprot:TRINITY_DN4528_c0_g1_i1.p1 TRINITY_DN4528_c0_g1~~TRINITY_DN4528_c0_g1_i1.p1  ORF type:complete len:110 (-),score=13.89 TRINITY_DN4528_c0_g1_i1:25-354(-)
MSDWDTGIFDLMIDQKVCMVSTFCLPCQLAYQKATIEEHQCGIMDLLFSIICFCPCGAKVRGDIRGKYGIDGSPVADCLSITFCPCCTVAQQTRQLDIKGLKPAGFLMD